MTDVALPTTYRLGIGTAVPAPDPDVLVDVLPFARLGGLLPGETANVVLRVEVLADGRAGEVAVDVSSGSDQVDHAAVAYAKAIRWLCGAVDGTPETMWVRIGITLRA